MTALTNTTVFTEIRFWLLVTSSFVLPFCIYGVLFTKRVISRHIVLIFGLLLVAIAGLDVYLLQSLSQAARHMPSLADAVFFVSEIRFALYVLPVMFGGIGVNILSHILIRHLVTAENRFEKEHLLTETRQFNKQIIYSRAVD